MRFALLLSILLVNTVLFGACSPRAAEEGAEPVDMPEESNVGNDVPVNAYLDNIDLSGSIGSDMLLLTKIPAPSTEEAMAVNEKVSEGMSSFGYAKVRTSLHGIINQTVLIIMNKYSLTKYHELEREYSVFSDCLLGSDQDT